MKLYHKNVTQFPSSQGHGLKLEAKDEMVSDDREVC